MSKKPIFLLIDAHAVIYRAFYAFPIQLTNEAGQPINAVYGFSRIILTAIRNYEPIYMAVTFDHPKPTFRHKKFDAYKAKRPKMPDELQPQIPIIKEVVEALNIPKYEIEGFEADDLIGTISDKIEKIGNLLTVIVTGDQDTFQLVDNNTHVWLPARGKFGKDKEYDADGVIEKLGVTPAQIVDYKAIVGDNSDNIPGIKGIGPKTAVNLLKKYQTLDKIYEVVEDNQNLDPKIFKPALVKKLIEGKETALMSKQLALIERVVNLDFDLEACRVSSYDKTKAAALFNRLDFKSLINLLPEDQFEKEVQASLF